MFPPRISASQYLLNRPEQVTHHFSGDRSLLSFSQKPHRLVDYFLLEPLVITDPFGRAERSAQNTWVTLGHDTRQGLDSTTVFFEFFRRENHPRGIGIPKSNSEIRAKTLKLA